MVNNSVPEVQGLIFEGNNGFFIQWAHKDFDCIYTYPGGSHGLKTESLAVESLLRAEQGESPNMGHDSIAF